MKNTLLFLTFTLFIFAGCSGKQYFEPEETISYKGEKHSIGSSIKSFNRNGATLKNDFYISKEGISKNNLPKGFEFVNYSNGNLIATDNISKILLNDEVIEASDAVVAASAFENKLALIFSNNTISIFDTATREVVFKEYLKESIPNDTRIANPLFLDNLVLFPTLDGKIVVVEKNTNTAIRNISVDLDSTFNNIIFLETVNNVLVAATNNKIIIISPSNVNIKDYEIRDIVANDTNIYIATVDGRLVKLDLNLNEVGSKKYKFAKFYAIAFKNGLYALESQGYMVKVDENFENDVVYDFSFSEGAKTIGIDDMIYFDDKYLSLD